MTRRPAVGNTPMGSKKGCLTGYGVRYSFIQVAARTLKVEPNPGS